MKPHPKKLKDKKLLKMQRDLNEFYAEKPMVEPLAEPIQQGWKRYLIPTLLTVRHANHRVIAKLLNYTKPQVHRHRHFKAIDGKTKRLVDICAYPFRTINHNEFDKDQFCVLPHGLLWECHGGPRCRQHKYLTPNPHYHVEVDVAKQYFEPKVVANMLTHVYLVDGEKMSKKQKIQNRLNEGGWYRLTKLAGGYGRYHDPKAKVEVAAKEAETEQLKDLE